MTDNQETTNSTPLFDNYETIIFYAGVMKYILERVDPLDGFATLADFMPITMKEKLFPLVSHHISMSRQKILGLVPVLRPYKRLNPLFYRLSETENLFYTVEDVFLKMELQSQEQSQEYKERLMNQREELRKEMSKGTKTKGHDPNYDMLMREYEVLEAEGRLPVFSRSTMNKIIPEVLPNLTIAERKVLLGSPALNTIRGILEVFNNRFPESIQMKKLETSSTPVKAHFAPLYNYELGMKDTLEETSSYTTVDTKDFEKLELLSRRLEHNPNNERLKRQYAELSARLGHPYPFRKLSKKFKEDMVVFEKLFRKETSTEELREAREEIEKDMGKYHTICRTALTTKHKTRLAEYKNTAIYIEG